MGKKMDKFLDMLGIGDEYEEEEEEIITFAPQNEELAATSNLKTFEANSRKTNNLIELTSSRPMATVKLVIVVPTQFDEVQKICDDLKGKKASIVNFEKTNKEVAQRMVDFLSGAIYAVNGNMKKVSNSIIVVAPQNIDLMGSIKYTMEENTDKEFDISKWLK